MKHCLLIIFLISICTTTMHAVTQEKLIFPVASDDFEQRLDTLYQRIDVVESSLKQAEGYAKSAGLIDLQVAKFFAGYISWELAHPDIMKDALATNESYFGQGELTMEEREQRYRNHIDRELTGSMTILDQAMLRLHKDDQMPGLKPIHWSDMVYKDGNFRVGDRIVFPGGFTLLGWDLINHERYPQWTAADEAASRDFLPKMRDIGVGMVDINIPLASLITAQGTVDPTKINQQIDDIKAYQAIGLKVDVMLNWGGNEVVLEKRWPGITRHASNGVAIDIDHPGARAFVKQVMAKLIPLVSKQKAVLSYDMANEPFFDMDGWTEYTMNAYDTWLAERHGSITAMNKEWQTNYDSFQPDPAAERQTEAGMLRRRMV